MTRHNRKIGTWGENFASMLLKVQGSEVVARKQEPRPAAAVYDAAEHKTDHWRIEVIASEGSADNKLRMPKFNHAL